MIRNTQMMKTKTTRLIPREDTERKNTTPKKYMNTVYPKEKMRFIDSKNQAQNITRFNTTTKIVPKTIKINILTRSLYDERII